MTRSYIIVRPIQRRNTSGVVGPGVCRRVEPISGVVAGMVKFDLTDLEDINPYLAELCWEEDGCWFLCHRSLDGTQ
jgi:hypothetical protein